MLKVFILTTKHSITKKNIAAFLLLVLALLVALAFGIIHYNDSVDRTDYFQKKEIISAKRHLTFSMYGTYGAKLMAAPSPLSVFFLNSGAFVDISSFIDTSSRLYVGQSLKNREQFFSNVGIDFAGVFFLFFSIYSLISGAYTFKDKVYIKSILNFFSFKKAFFYIVVSRVIFLNLLIIFVLFMSGIFVLLNGIPITIDFYIYSVISCLIFSFLYLIGTAIHSKKNLIILSAVFMFIPGLINLAFFLNNDNADLIDELKGLENVIQLEKRAKATFGPYTTANLKPTKEAILKLIESGQRIEYSVIRKMQRDQIDNSIASTKMYHLISIFFPTSFYLSLSKELSGRGLVVHNDFHYFAYLEKIKFIKFFIHHKFRKETKEVVPYSDCNVFYSVETLPHFLVWGLILHNIYFISLYFISFYRQKMIFFPPTKNNFEIDLTIQTNLHTQIIAKDTRFFDQFINSCSGIGPLCDKIKIGSLEMKTGKKKAVLYLGDPFNHNSLLAFEAMIDYRLPYVNYNGIMEIILNVMSFEIIPDIIIIDGWSEVASKELREWINEILDSGKTIIEFSTKNHPAVSPKIRVPIINVNDTFKVATGMLKESYNNPV